MKSNRFLFLVMSLMTLGFTSVLVSSCSTSTAQRSSNADGKGAVCESVDLGLSVNWATCNVGASSPTDFGGYFAWGEVQSKSSYDWESYKLCKGSLESITKYCVDNGHGSVDGRQTLDKSDDAATVALGGSWRIPTRDEVRELTEKCTWTWTNAGGVSGYKVTSNVQGYTDKSIFLPAGGYRWGTTSNESGLTGCYWSSSVYPDDSSNAYNLTFNSLNVEWYMDGRASGFAVRPVINKN